MKTQEQIKSSLSHNKVYRLLNHLRASKSINVCLLFIVLLFIQANAFAYNLRIADVRNSWSTYQASIDTAEISVQSQGMYAICDLTLVFPAKSSKTFYSGDSLEVQLDFTLPQGSEVIDLWLWIYDKQERAKIYDKSTAVRIYETIVSRRKDPALLTVNSSGNYTLKVFPVMTNMPRKVKIRYITPILNPVSLNASIPLPMDILNNSYYAIKQVSIQYSTPTENETPVLLGDSTWVPTSNGMMFQYIKQNCKTFSSMSILLKNSASQLFSGSLYKDPLTNETYYQIAFQPAKPFNLSKVKKFLVLIDFNTYFAYNFTQVNILDKLKTSLSSQLTEKDSFNIIITGTPEYSASSNWLPASKQAIEDACNKISKKGFKSYNNLPSLLFAGMQFIEDHNNEGEILLLSNSTDFDKLSAANGLIKEIEEKNWVNNTPINVIDLYDWNYNSYYTYYYYNEAIYYNNTYYLGNQYLYTFLTTSSSGEFFSPTITTYSNALDKVFTRQGGYFENLEYYLLPYSGYTYANFKTAGSTGVVYYNETVKITGKINGSFPLDLVIAGQNMNDSIFYNKISIDHADLIQTDSTLKMLWASLYIRDLKTKTTSITSNALLTKTSLNYHILNEYTSLLVLEPGMDTLFAEETATTNGNGTWIMTDIEEKPDMENKQFTCSIYPNPIVDNATISFTMPEKGNVQMILYDMYGKQIKVLYEESVGEGEHTSTFNAEDLASGIYLCVVLVNGEVKTKEKIVVNR